MIQKILEQEKQLYKEKYKNISNKKLINNKMSKIN